MGTPFRLKPVSQETMAIPSLGFWPDYHIAPYPRTFCDTGFFLIFFLRWNLTIKPLVNLELAIQTRPAPASRVLGYKACTTTPTLNFMSPVTRKSYLDGHIKRCDFIFTLRFKHSPGGINQKNQAISSWIFIFSYGETNDRKCLPFASYLIRLSLIQNKKLGRTKGQPDNYCTAPLFFPLFCLCLPKGNHSLDCLGTHSLVFLYSTCEGLSPISNSKVHALHI